MLNRLLRLRRYCHMKTQVYFIFVCIAIVLWYSFCTECENCSQRDINQSKTGKQYYLIVLILTAPNSVTRRAIIRDTWLKLGEKWKSQIHYRFVIGIRGLDFKAIQKLRSESPDLLLLSSLTDQYESLSLKMMDSLTWASGKKFDYLLKVDDDSFVQLDKLVDSLKEMGRPNGRLYMGFMDGRANVKLRGKWAEPAWKLCDHYLPYAKGGGYILGHELVQFIGDNQKYLKLYKSEDVSVGVWLSGVDLTYKHDVRFDTEYISRGCNNQYLITHKQNDQMMKQLYSNVKQLGKLCEIEIKLRKSYEYDWNVVPSLCCNRTRSDLP